MLIADDIFATSGIQARWSAHMLIISSDHDFIRPTDRLCGLIDILNIVNFSRPNSESRPVNSIVFDHILIKRGATMINWTLLRCNEFVSADNLWLFEICAGLLRTHTVPERSCVGCIEGEEKWVHRQFRVTGCLLCDILFRVFRRRIYRA